MKPYIYGKRNLIHIIDVRETLRGLVITRKFAVQLARDGKEVIFVGTKRQARSIVQQEAERCGMHYVSERWLGGTLTNFATIRRRLKRLDELESMEQTGEIYQYSKKMISSLHRQEKKIRRNLQGVRNMTQLPGALVVIDPHREHIAIKEARKLGIPTMALADTNCDPDMVDIIVPGNDDAIKAIRIMCGVVADALEQGAKERAVRLGQVTPIEPSAPVVVQPPAPAPQAEAAPEEPAAEPVAEPAPEPAAAAPAPVDPPQPAAPAPQAEAPPEEPAAEPVAEPAPEPAAAAPTPVDPPQPEAPAEAEPAAAPEPPAAPQATDAPAGDAPSTDAGQEAAPDAEPE